MLVGKACTDVGIRHFVFNKIRCHQTYATIMLYLILAAGMGKRMGSAHAGVPKCLIDINGELLIERLLRQIRQYDARADIHVVLGCAGVQERGHHAAG